MANYTPFRYIQIDGGNYNGTDTFTYTGTSSNLDGTFTTVFDNDSSGGISPADTWQIFPYAGFTITIGDSEYAVFSNFSVDGDTRFFLPHSGEVEPGDIPASPVSVMASTMPAVANCFLEGTQISTVVGDLPIEDLATGDRILSNQGGSVRVKWVGRQAVSTRFGPAERLMPVRVRAGALGSGLPTRDLTLTADHALLIDGLLINAGALVNGTTIDYVPLSELGDSYTVYHIETENHDVILAEGAPAETYIDYVARRSFDNYAEYLALYGEDRTIPEMLYPRISSARQLPQPLAARLGITRAA